MTNGTKRVKAGIIVHKILIGLFRDGRIGPCNGFGQVANNAAGHSIGPRVGIDAVLFFQLFHKFVAAFIIQIIELFIQLRVFGSDADNGPNIKRLGRHGRHAGRSYA